MKLSHKAKKNFEEDNEFYIKLGKRLRQARRILVFISGFSIVVIILAIMAIDAKQKATLEKENAIKQEKNAKEQTKIAKSAEKEAERQKILADQSKDAALVAKEEPFKFPFI